MRPGDAWGIPASGDPDLVAHGGDAELAAVSATVIERRPGALVRFVPDAACDFARAIGLTTQSSGDFEVAVDLLRISGPGAGERDGFPGELAVNMLVVGARPDRLRAWTRSRVISVEVDGRLLYDGRATSVVVANGQYLDGSDVVPRGHPGDGRLEVQVYALAPGERRAMRRRLGGGTHVPHPRIVGTSGRRVDLVVQPPTGSEVDGVAFPPRSRWSVEVVPEALRLLV